MSRPSPSRPKASPHVGGQTANHQKTFNSSSLVQTNGLNVGDEHTEGDSAPDIATQMDHALRFGQAVPTESIQRNPEEDEELKRKPDTAFQRQTSTNATDDDDEETFKSTIHPKLGNDDEGIHPLEEDDKVVHPKISVAALQRRQNEAEEIHRQREEEEELRPKLIQTKLTIGQPGDKYEQEADRTAARVMAMPNPVSAGEQESGGEREQSEAPLQRRIYLSALVQRQDLEEKKEDDLARKPLIQLRGDSLVAPDNFESQLAQHHGRGQPLSDKTRAFMEPRFGADFSGVRVHEAPKETGAIGAQAFTHGQDIYFNAGKYNPGSSSGKELLAHELTHTIQQTSGQLRSKSIVNYPNKNNKLQTKVDISLVPVSTLQLKETPQPQGADNPVPSSPPTGKKSSTSDKEFIQGEAQRQPQPSPSSSGEDASSPPPSASGSGNSNGSNTTTKPAALATQDESQKSVTAPSQDPAFQAVVSQASGVAEQRKQHDPAQAESQEAQDAAVPPGNEVESKAQDQQVGEMNQQQPGAFNAAAFKAALLEKIAAVTPKNEEEAERFKDDNQLDSVRQDVSTQVTQEQEQAAGAIEEKTQESPDTAAIEPKSVTPMQAPETGEAATDIGAEGAAPKPKPDAEVTAPLNAGSQELDQRMTQSEVTEEQLAKSNEPQFLGALDAKKQAQTHAATAPTAYRQDEQGIVTQAQAEAQGIAHTQLQGMQGQQEQSLQKVAGLQGETKGKDEQERTKVANDINGIYTKTKTDVEAILSQLDSDVTNRFDTGASAAKQKFEDYVKEKMDAYKQERYGDWWDPSKWGNRIRDTFVGLPPEVDQFFVDGRQLYLSEMDVCLTEIANLVADKLNQAKQRITQGKQEIQQYVVSLPQSLQQMGQEAAQNIQSKFDELEQSVDSKQDELLNTLAQKYQENLQEIDARIEEMKEANKGLLHKAIDFIVNVAQVIAELAALIAQVLARVASVIPQILQDPIGFLSNLIEGLKQGFMNFMKNVGQYLQQGLIGWLTGAIAGAGLQLPEKLDLKGIFSLVTQVLGFTYQSIRAMVVKRVKSEETVSRVEQSVDWFQALATEGPGGLWPIVQEKIGDLKAMFLDPLKNFVIQNVVVAGIEWILSLMNPASAFVKACKMIYQIIKFFMENAERIVDLINAILDSITAIAEGSLGKAAQLVESSMAKSLPVIISFLANLLGLGNISQKVQDIIQKIRKPIEKAINWIIDKVVKISRKLSKKLGLQKGKKNKNSKPGEQEKAAKNKDSKPDERKKAAKNKFISLMRAKESMSKEEMNGVFVKLKNEFHLSTVRLEGNQSNPKIGFYASPATFLPLSGFVPNMVRVFQPNRYDISGQKPGKNAQNSESIAAGDYIRATHYDGPFPTPGKEIVDQFNNRFKGKNITRKRKMIGDEPGDSPPEKVRTLDPKALPLQTATKANTYLRAGIVEAKSSVPRKKGRSGGGETVFGHFGADEEKIKTGQRKTNYNGGHLIGDQIMDSHQSFNLYEDWNLAPQQRSFNSPVYSGIIENPVAKAIKAGATIQYTVKVQYPGNTYRIKPSVLVQNLLPAADGYREQIQGAIKQRPALNQPFTLRRRTPGFWQATAKVIKGGKISSGKNRKRQDVDFENNPVNVGPTNNYLPVAREQVRYSLEVDQGKGGRLQEQKGPIPNNPLKYAGATMVRATARQQTF